MTTITMVDANRTDGRHTRPARRPHANRTYMNVIALFLHTVELVVCMRHSALHPAPLSRPICLQDVRVLSHGPLFIQAMSLN